MFFSLWVELYLVSLRGTAFLCNNVKNLFAGCQSFEVHPPSDTPGSQGQRFRMPDVKFLGFRRLRELDRPIREKKSKIREQDGPPCGLTCLRGVMTGTGPETKIFLNSFPPLLSHPARFGKIEMSWMNRTPVITPIQFSPQVISCKLNYSPERLFFFPMSVWMNVSDTILKFLLPVDSCGYKTSCFHG